jgi:hypothetical protein
LIGGLVNKFTGHPSLQIGGPLFEWVPMCGKCVELDKRIEHYQKMLLAIADQITVERLRALIGDLQAQKAALHPEQP